MVDIYLHKEMCRGGLDDAAHHLLAAESLGSWHLLTIARAKKLGSAQRMLLTLGKRNTKEFCFFQKLFVALVKGNDLADIYVEVEHPGN